MLEFYEPEVELCQPITEMQRRDALFSSFTSSSSSSSNLNLINNSEGFQGVPSSTSGKQSGSFMTNNMVALRSKKQKISHPVEETLRMNATVKKSQKLGDKITALQQLVSPFGKTDTASVLHEATICIKALHEQIQVMTSPYFQIKSRANSQHGLHGRGLCLVPISPSIINFANQHGDPDRFAWSLGRGSSKN